MTNLHKNCFGHLFFTHIAFSGHPNVKKLYQIIKILYWLLMNYCKKKISFLGQLIVYSVINELKILLLNILHLRKRTKR